MFDSKTSSFQVALVDDVGLDQIYVHHPENKMMSYLLSELQGPELPTPIGVIHQHQRPTYDQLMKNQLEYAQTQGRPSFQSILESGETWEVNS